MCVTHEAYSNTMATANCLVQQKISCQHMTTQVWSSVNYYYERQVCPVSFCPLNDHIQPGKKMLYQKVKLIC